MTFLIIWLSIATEFSRSHCERLINNNNSYSFLLCQISRNTLGKRKSHLKVTEEAVVEVSTNSFPAVATSSAAEHEIILKTDDGRVDVGCNAPPRHIFQSAYADSSRMEIQGKKKTEFTAMFSNPPKMLFVPQIHCVPLKSVCPLARYCFVFFMDSLYRNISNKETNSCFFLSGENSHIFLGKAFSTIAYDDVKLNLDVYLQ